MGVVSHQASFQTPIQDFISGKLIPMTLSRVRITQSIYYLLQGSDPWCLTLNHGRKKVCNSSVQRVNCHINYWAIRLTVAPAALTLSLQLIMSLIIQSITHIPLKTEDHISSAFLSRTNVRVKLAGIVVKSE